MKHSILFSLCLLCLAACEQKEEMIPNKLYIVNEGVKKQVIVDPEAPCIYELTVYKSGKSHESGTVKLEVDEDYLSGYNAANESDLKVLPEHYYTCSSGSLIIGPDETSGMFTVNIDSKKIITDLGYGLNYAIPFKIVSGNDNIAIVPAKANVLLPIDILEPYLNIMGDAITDVWFSHYDATTNFTYQLGVMANFPNKWDIDVEFDLDPSLIDTYNEGGKDPLEIMPQEAFSFSNKVVSLKANENEAFTTIQVDGKKLKNWHSYAIPLKVKSSSKFQFAEDKSSVMVIYRPDNLQGWYTTTRGDKNTDDWSVNKPDGEGFYRYPFKRYILKTGPYTYETGYGSRTYCNQMTPTGSRADRQFIYRDPKDNSLVIQEGDYAARTDNAGNYYDTEKEELTIKYEFSAWANWWTHEFMTDRTSEK